MARIRIVKEGEINGFLFAKGCTVVCTKLFNSDADP